MLTEFGKFTRKLRIEINETLYNMAQKLGVSSAFLSSVEIGNKSIPKNWLELLSEKYNLNKEQKEELEKVIALSNKIMKVDFTNKNLDERELFWKLAKRADNIDKDTIEKIFNILKEE